MGEFKYEIKQKLGVIGTSGSGWTKELNVVSWYDKEPKMEIRDWPPEKDRAGKGVILTKEEAATLRDILNRLTEEKII